MVFDTDVLIYASDEDSEFHDLCLRRLEEARRDPFPSFVTWSICHEFLRVVTNRRVLRSPWGPQDSWRFIETLLASPSFELLHPTERHPKVLGQTLSELPDVRGSLVRNLHTAVLMREHGVSRICTRDTDFHRFPFLTVVDPLR